MQTVRGTAQNKAKKLQGLPEGQRGREGTHPLCSWQQHSCSPQEAIYWFGNMMALAMINHLRLKTVIRMTTTQKYEYKTNGYNTPWDPTMSITVYFSLLNCFQVLLGDCGIATSNEEKTMAAGAQMWQSETFTEDQMVVWETRGAMAQMWAALQTYFTKKWLRWKQYLATTAKQSQFKEAALLTQETAAAEEEGKTQVLLFGMLQDQHAKQIVQI
jgi:hypothetical protein